MDDPLRCGGGGAPAGRLHSDGGACSSSRASSRLATFAEHAPHGWARQAGGGGVAGAGPVKGAKGKSSGVRRGKGEVGKGKVKGKKGKF